MFHFLQDLKFYGLGFTTGKVLFFYAREFSIFLCSTVNSHLSGPHLSGYLAVHTFGLEQIYLVHLSLN